MERSTIAELSLGDILEESDAREVRRRTPSGRPRVSLVRQLLRPEPMFWQLFSAGGFVAALLLPITVAVLLIEARSVPSEALSYERVVGLVDHLLAKLYLLALISLPLFHWAHRFRYTVHHQFGVHGLKGLVAVACYGTAIAGGALAFLVLLRI